MRAIEGLTQLSLSLAFAIHDDPHRAGLDAAVISKPERASQEIESVLFGATIAEAEVRVLVAMSAARKELPEKLPVDIDLMADIGEDRQQGGGVDDSVALRSQEVALLKQAPPRLVPGHGAHRCPFFSI